MTRSLQARIHDPLWLLARQWQVGEFQGEDAGSPVRVELKVEQGQLSKYFPGRPETDPNDPTEIKDKHKIVSYTETVPLETQVEREPISYPGKDNLRQAVEAGLQFFRLLEIHQLKKYRQQFLDHFKIQSSSLLDDAGLRFLSLVADRVIDGVKLRSKFAAPGQGETEPKLPNEIPFDSIDSGDNANFIKVVKQWLEWYDLLFAPSDSHDLAWQPERMEYEFAVSAPATTPKKELTLVAPEYVGGHLDWYSFEVDLEHTLKASEQSVISHEAKALPTPLQFHGMPAARWWEFEEAEVHFGDIEAAPEDLARLLLTEFILLYGNDFYLIPLELEVGTICRIADLRVFNTFGEHVEIKPTGQVDEEIGDKSVPWRMFCLSLLAKDPDEKTPLLDFLFLPPVLGRSLESSPLEEVLLLRDEMANLAWAIERVVESPVGLPLRRFELYQAKRRQEQLKQEATSPDSTAPKGGPLTYRLATPVPDYWLPLIPISNQAHNLELGGLHHPEGYILKPSSEEKLVLAEEEVPRTGVCLTRSYQYTRWHNGETYLWIARRKRPGSGEGSSGLKFDLLETKEP